MDVIKNILFVSYLKNKGVRRICFILGLILFLLSFSSLNNEIHIQNHSFKNIDDVRDKNVNILVQDAIYDKYPFHFSTDDGFHKWQHSFLYKGTSEYKNLKEIERRCEKINETINTKNPHILNNICIRLKEYKNQPMTVWTYRESDPYILLLIMLSFYLPFMLCCLVKWIYEGFREQ